MRFSGAARRSRAPQNACCSAKDQASCVSHVLLLSCGLILGASIFKARGLGVRVLHVVSV